MSDTVKPDIEPPLMRDGSLVVRCDYSGCNNTHEVGTDVDAVQSTAGRDSWRISFVPTVDGRLEVDGVECPDHRVSDEIDALASVQSDYARSQAQTEQIVEQLEPE